MKVKDSEIKKRYPLCLGNISKDFTANNMKKTGLNRYSSIVNVSNHTKYVLLNNEKCEIQPNLIN